MNAGMFLKIKSVISVFSGLTMVFLSAYLMQIFDISLDRGGTVMSQWTGACLTGIGIICWYSSNEAKSALRDGVLLALFICDTIAFAVTLIAKLSGLGNVLVWSNVILWLVLALGLAYYRFIDKSE